MAKDWLTDCYSPGQKLSFEPIWSTTEEYLLEKRSIRTIGLLDTNKCTLSFMGMKVAWVARRHTEKEVWFTRGRASDSA